MPKSYPPITCTRQERARLEELAADDSKPRLALRCKFVLRCLEGRQIKDIAAEFHERPNTITLWRRRFSSEGIAGLYSKPRGKPKTVYDQQALGEQLEELLQTEPPAGEQAWTGSALAKKIGVPPYAVWRYLKKHGINLTKEGQFGIEHHSLDLLVTLSYDCSKEDAESRLTDSKMDLDVNCKLTGKSGVVINESAHFDNILPCTNSAHLAVRKAIFLDLDDQSFPDRNNHSSTR